MVYTNKYMSIDAWIRYLIQISLASDGIFHWAYNNMTERFS